MTGLNISWSGSAAATAVLDLGVDTVDDGWGKEPLHDHAAVLLDRGADHRWIRRDIEVLEFRHAPNFTSDV